MTETDLDIYFHCLSVREFYAITLVARNLAGEIENEADEPKKAGENLDSLVAVLGDRLAPADAELGRAWPKGTPDYKKRPPFKRAAQYLKKWTKLLEDARRKIHKVRTKQGLIKLATDIQALCDATDRAFALSAPVDLPTSETTELAVACVDLVGYSLKAANLQTTANVAALAAYNKQIHDMIRAAAKEAQKIIRSPLVFMGDGALIGFDTVDNAHLFAESLSKAAHARNRTPGSTTHSHFYFRIGITCGHILLERPSGTVDTLNWTGIALSDAKRLETACPIGNVMMDIHAWQKLKTESHRHRYGKAREVSGKHPTETFTVMYWEDAGPRPPTEASTQG